MALEIAPTTFIEGKDAIEFWDYFNKVEKGEIEKETLIHNQASEIYDRLNKKGDE